MVSKHLTNLFCTPFFFKSACGKCFLFCLTDGILLRNFNSSDYLRDISAVPNELLKYVSDKTIKSKLCMEFYASINDSCIHLLNRMLSKFQWQKRKDEFGPGFGCTLPLIRIANL